MCVPPAPSTLGARKFECKLFDVACVQCGHPPFTSIGPICFALRCASCVDEVLPFPTVLIFSNPARVCWFCPAKFFSFSSLKYSSPTELQQDHNSLGESLEPEVLQTYRSAPRDKGIFDQSERQSQKRRQDHVDCESETIASG